jgi:hypothetical protein
VEAKLKTCGSEVKNVLEEMKALKRIGASFAAAKFQSILQETKFLKNHRSNTCSKTECGHNTMISRVETMKKSQCPNRLKGPLTSRMSCTS